MTSTSALDAELPSEKTAALDSSSEDNDGQPPSSDGEQYFMSGSKLALIIGGLCIALFLLGLDTAIVSTVSNSHHNPRSRKILTGFSLQAIPRITARFHSTSDIGWYGSAYFLSV
jgi:hypothetical protein